MNQRSFHFLSPNNLIIYSLLSGFVLLSGCEKEPVPLTTNSVLQGNARYGSGSEEGGVKVIAYGPYGESSAVTDAWGNYKFTGMGNGTYCLDFSREGYGTVRQYGIQLFGSDTVTARSVDLYALPGPLMLPFFKRTFIGVRPRYYPEKDWICFETDVTKQNSDRYGFQFLMCMAKDEKVSIDHYQIIDFSWSGQYNGDAYLIYIDIEAFYERYRERLPFKSGDKVYVRAYPFNKSEGIGYLDTYLGVPQYSTLDKTRSTNIISFTMP